LFVPPRFPELPYMLVELFVCVPPAPPAAFEPPEDGFRLPYEPYMLVELFVCVPPAPPAPPVVFEPPRLPYEP